MRQNMSMIFCHNTGGSIKKYKETKTPRHWTQNEKKRQKFKKILCSTPMASIYSTIRRRID